MSRLHRTNITTTLEPKFDHEVEEEEVYEPLHPTLEALALSKILKDTNKDHLDNFVEVNPFEKEEKK
jgi:hypothetical protein